MKKILVGTDFSEHSIDVIESAIALARAFDGSIDLLHVREPFVYAVTAGFVPSPEQQEVLIDWIDKSLSEQRDVVTQAGIPCLTTSLNGAPHTQITQHAERTSADIIIVGTHGRTGVAHAVLGSVAERVVQKARCPVLVIPYRR